MMFRTATKHCLRQCVAGKPAMNHQSFPKVVSACLHTGTSSDKKVHSIHDKEAAAEYEKNEHKSADHFGRQQNHIWDKEEITDRFASIYRHEPKSLSDKFMNSVVS